MPTARLSQLPEPPGEADKGYMGLADGLDQWWVAQHRFVGRWDGQRWMQIPVGIEVDSDKVGFAPAKDGGMWFLLNKELRKYRSGTEVSRLELPWPELLRGGVWSMSEDSRGNVWICTDRGIFQVSSAGKVRHWTFTNGLSSNSTRFVFEDRENNLWVGTSGGGLQRFKARRFYSFGVEERSEPPQVVSSVLSIVDNGVGFCRDAVQEKAGLGLVSIQERVQIVKGQLIIRSSPNEGTRIEIRVPISWKEKRSEHARKHGKTQAAAG